jgi:hypothetical protein
LARSNSQKLLSSLYSDRPGRNPLSLAKRPHAKRKKVVKGRNIRCQTDVYLSAHLPTHGPPLWTVFPTILCSLYMIPACSISAFAVCLPHSGTEPSPNHPPIPSSTTSDFIHHHHQGNNASAAATAILLCPHLQPKIHGDYASTIIAILALLVETIGPRVRVRNRVRSRKCVSTTPTVCGCYSVSNVLDRNYCYVAGHPMKPHRIRMTNSLIMNYGLYKEMEIYVRRTKTPRRRPH